MGDGGTGIGGAHLLSAARRNIGITVLVLNNFNFGMTGGQHSTTTPAGAVTSTTPGGNLERPLDICATVAANGAGFTYRGTSFDADLALRLAEGIASPGLAVMDVWELCTAYYVPRNRLSKKALFALLDRLGLPTGVLHRRHAPEYAAAYRAAAQGRSATDPAPPAIVPRFAAPLDRPYRLVAAGSAGAHVGRAARVLARAALLSGQWAALRTDYPITVKTGHSVAELIVSPDRIRYAGITRPDALVLLSPEGLAKAARYLDDMGEDGRVFTLPATADVRTRASVSVIDPAQAAPGVPRAHTALTILTRVATASGIVSLEAVEQAVRESGGEDADGMRRAVAQARP